MNNKNKYPDDIYYYDYAIVSFYFGGTTNTY